MTLLQHNVYSYGFFFWIRTLRYEYPESNFPGSNRQKEELLSQANSNFCRNINKKKLILNIKIFIKNIHIIFYSTLTTTKLNIKTQKKKSTEKFQLSFVNIIFFILIFILFRYTKWNAECYLNWNNSQKYNTT